MELAKKLSRKAAKPQRIGRYFINLGVSLSYFEKKLMFLSQNK